MFTAHRLAGYRCALEGSDPEFDPSLVVEGDLSRSSGYRMMSWLLELDHSPTGRALPSSADDGASADL